MPAQNPEGAAAYVIRIDPQIFQRESFYVVAVCLAFGLFLCVRHATRSRSARGRSLSKARPVPKEAAFRPSHFPEGTDWMGQEGGRHPLPITFARAHVWEITLFASRGLDPLESLQLEGARYFSLGRDAEGTERILTPMVRKLIARFRPEFERNEAISYAKSYSRRTPGTKALVSWLSSERHIHHVCHWFLTEMHKVAREAGVVPSLEIRFDDTLVLSVRMPYARELSVLQSLCRDNELVTVALTRESVSIDLWVAFSQDSLPSDLFRDSVAESSRDKRRAS